MSFIVHNVIEGGAQIDFEYLGSHHMFGLRRAGSYTFSIDELHYEEGEILYSAEEAFTALRKAYTKKQIAAKIGVDIYRAGIITSLQRETENSINHNTVRISIEERERVEDDGELSYINESVPSPQKLRSFSDTYSFQRSADQVSYNRNISISYADDLSDQFLNNAYMFIKNVYYRNRQAYGFQTDGLSEKLKSNSGFSPRVSENYDLINKTVSINENLNASNVDGNYSKKVTYSIETTREGFREKNYNVEIIGLKKPVHHEALNGIKAVLDQIKSDNESEFGNPISINKGVAKDAGIITADINFSTNPSINQENTFVYSVQRERDRSFFRYTISSTRKTSDKDKSSGYSKILSTWENEQNIPKQKVSVLFPEASEDNLFESSRSTTFNPFNLELQENIVYSSDPAYNTTGDTLKKNVSVSVENPVERINIFNVPTERTRVQRLFKNTRNSLGKKVINVELIKKKDAGVLASEQEALNIAKQPPSGTNWIAQKSSSIDPANGVTTASITYSFFNGS